MSKAVSGADIAICGACKEIMLDTDGKPRKKARTAHSATFADLSGVPPEPIVGASSTRIQGIRETPSASANSNPGCEGRGVVCANGNSTAATNLTADANIGAAAAAAAGASDGTGQQSDCSAAGIVPDAESNISIASGGAHGSNGTTEEGGGAASHIHLHQPIAIATTSHVFRASTRSISSRFRL
eukprot:4510464-Pleurochrysis_carterae.AAC.1